MHMKYGNEMSVQIKHIYLQAYEMSVEYSLSNVIYINLLIICHRLFLTAIVAVKGILSHDLTLLLPREKRKKMSVRWQREKLS